MSRQDRLGPTATYVRTEGEWTHVRYHNTDVVSFSPLQIILRTGGWETMTTRARMNQASRQFGLGYTVSQRKGVWYVSRWGAGNKKPGSEQPFDKSGEHVIPQ